MLMACYVLHVVGLLFTSREDAARSCLVHANIDGAIEFDEIVPDSQSFKKRQKRIEDAKHKQRTIPTK